MLKTKIKCLPSGDTNAGPPSMIRLRFQVPRPLSLFLNTEEMTCLIFFVLTRYETVLLSRASRAASQGHLESGLVGQT